LFQHVDVLDYLATLDCSENIEIVAFVAGVSVLDNMLGQEHAQTLLQGLQILSMPSACVCKIPWHIDAILHASLSKQLTGNIGKLFAQAKVLEYICTLTEHVSGKKKEQKLPETGRLKQL